MTDQTVDAIDNLRKMGHAYKTITATMGPSAQLIAFINYDKVENPTNLELESFNIMEQHQKILADIEALGAAE